MIQTNIVDGPNDKGEKFISKLEWKKKHNSEHSALEI